MTDSFWHFSMATLPADISEDALKWYSAERLEHHLAAPECREAWLLDTIVHRERWGTPFPTLLAIYRVDDPISFAAGRFDTEEEWGPFAAELTDAQRLTRRVLFEYEARPGGSGCWASVRINFENLPYKDRYQEVAFNEWYNDTHVPEICAFPGFYRAWRLARTGRRQPVAYDEDYWAFYEVEEPATLMKPVLNPWWDGVWQNNIEQGSLARSYHTVREHLER